MPITEKSSNERAIEMITAHLQFPGQRGGALMIMPYNDLIFLVAKAYDAGVRDERMRKDVPEETSDTERFQSLEYREKVTV